MTKRDTFIITSSLPQTQDGDDSREKWEKSNTLPHKLSSSNSQTLPSSSSSNATSSLADSPQSRKRFGSASEETILKVSKDQNRPTNDDNSNHALLEFSLQQVNGSEFSLPPAFDMKAFKADILKEMRSEITKAKNEIIDGECFFRAKPMSFSREEKLV